MNGQFEQIRQELLLTKKELVDRLSIVNQDFETNVDFYSNNVSSLYEQEKHTILHHEMREELEDVNRALLKMEIGMYGVCEKTGETIPVNDLKILPTARTKAELEMNGMLQKGQQLSVYESLY